MKSEPTAYSIDDLQQEPNKTTSWDGIRNYQARNFMMQQMQIGDLVYFYHSSCKIPGIVGIAKVSSESYPDDTAFDPESKYYDPKSNPDNPRWFMVDIKLVKKFPQIITLTALRENPQLKDMLLLRRGNRLSITPVTTQEWNSISHML